MQPILACMNTRLGSGRTDLEQIRSSQCALSWSIHWNGICHFMPTLEITRRHSTALTRNAFGGLLGHHGEAAKSSYEGLTYRTEQNGQSTHRWLSNLNWRKARLLFFCFVFVLSCNWLDYETIHSAQQKWNIVDVEVLAGRPGFCSWFGPLLLHSKADAKKEKYCGRSLSSSRAEYL